MQNTLPVHFAPLQGYTEVIYRNAHAACFGGVDTYYTPFVRLEKGRFRRRDVRGMEPENNKVPHLVPQLIASSFEKAETILALFIEKGYREADINLGCPFPMLAKRHNGSGMLPYPEEVKELLRLVTAYPQISFSLKMRLGWESPDECLRLASIINDLPLRHVAVHPRLGKQQYKGEADREGFAAFAEVCKQPLVYNGDICSLQDIRRIEERFPSLAGIMIGRGLLANPALALEYKLGRTLTSDEMGEKLQSMHSLVFSGYREQLEGGETQLLDKMKSFWEYLLPDADKKLRKAILKSNGIEKYQQAANTLLRRL